MSYYGKRWSIDGVIAGPIIRVTRDSQYTVLFERQFASIEQIEGISWAAPTVAYIGSHEGEPGLPEGYGFDVSRIDYDSGAKTYKVVLRVASQYLGDVTGYQAQVAELETAVAEQAAAIRNQQATAAALTMEMENAYAEGVENNG